MFLLAEVNKSLKTEHWTELPRHHDTQVVDSISYTSVPDPFRRVASQRCNKYYISYRKQLIYNQQLKLIRLIYAEGLSRLVRIPALHAGGHGFKSHSLHASHELELALVLMNKIFL